MWYLLYDPDDDECYFELFHDNAPNSTTFIWFNLTYSDTMFDNAISYKHDVHTWVETGFDNTFILHSFPSKPTQGEVIAVIHSHPELLI